MAADRETTAEVNALTGLIDRINQAYEQDGKFGRRVRAELLPGDQYTAPCVSLWEDGHRIPIDTVWYSHADEPDYHGRRHEQPHFAYGPNFDHVIPADDLDAAAKQVVHRAGIPADEQTAEMAP